MDTGHHPVARFGSTGAAGESNARVQRSLTGRLLLCTLPWASFYLYPVKQASRMWDLKKASSTRRSAVGDARAPSRGCAEQPQAQQALLEAFTARFIGRRLVARLTSLFSFT